MPLHGPPDNGVVRRRLQLPDQLGEQAGPAADDLLEIPRDLAREGQHHVRTLAELPRQPDNGGLRGGGATSPRSILLR